jgi:hypothetical protein
MIKKYIHNLINKKIKVIKVNTNCHITLLINMHYISIVSKKYIIDNIIHIYILIILSI